MQRIISNMVLGYWLAFFAVHAAGQFGGVLSPKRSTGDALFYASGLAIEVPMTNYGLGLASIIIAVLFAWALLANAKSSVASDRKEQVEAYAFGGAGLVLSALTTLAIMHSDASSLLSSSVYFGCLLISWTAMRQGLEPRRSSDEKSDTSTPTFAQLMAQGAAHHNHLAKIAGRDMV
jgi:hypothetical protein